MEICPVILCGGSGTRLWPASRPDFPKQFLPLIGDLSSFQNAVLRLAGAPDMTVPIVVTGAAHEDLVRAQLAAIGVDGEIVIEPQGRDSCPAVAAAVYFRLERAPGTIFVAQPADGHIPDAARFRELIAAAALGAAKGKIVTLAIVPTEPSPSFGYIAPGDAVAEAPGVMTVKRFVEKPSRETAVAYIGDGFLWNAGIFVFDGRTFAEELETFQPEMAACVKDAVANGARANGALHLDPLAFGRTPKISIDYAVMEKTKRAATVRADLAWSDLGAWAAVHEVGKKNEQRNVVAGSRVALIDTKGSFVYAPHMTVAVVGLEGVGVIAEHDAVLVCKLDESHAVKNAVEALKAGNHHTVLRRTEHRARTTSLADFGAEFDVWFEASALPLWWAMGADHTNGGFFGALNQRGHAVPMQKRFRVQARQTFVYATAGTAGWQGPWRDAVAHGARFMHQSHLREDGLYCGAAAGASGRDDATTLYDQAFALLAFSAIERALPGETESRAAAARVYDALTASHAHPLGGFNEAEMHGSRLQSNPHMHLLEASLAWAALPDGGRWKELAGQIVTLCARHFIDQETGAVGEFYADDGRPAAGAAGTLVDAGHQFEWAYLLTQASQSLDHSSAAALAKRLYEIGNRHGVDRTRGVAIDELSDDLSVRSARARLWPQTERLKASLAFARLAAGDAREAFERDAEDAARGLHFYFDTPVKGLWRDKMRPDGTFVNEPTPATSFYHIACAILELRRYLADRG